MNPKTVCQICGRVISLRKPLNNNKYHYRHKCPHGFWCPSGHRLHGYHANNPKVGVGGCRECWERVHVVYTAKSQ